MYVCMKNTETNVYTYLCAFLYMKDGVFMEGLVAEGDEVSTLICMYICTSIIYVYIYIYVCIHKNISVCMYVCMYEKYRDTCIYAFMSFFVYERLSVYERFGI
jgi:hypothetical protein